MHRLPFGFRFYLVCGVSFILADLWLNMSVPAEGNLTISEAALAASVASLFYGFATFGYYLMLGRILKSRIRKPLYILYLVAGWMIAAYILKTSFGLWSVLSGSGIPISQLYRVLGFTLIVPSLLAFLPPFILYRLECLKENPNIQRWFQFGHGGSARWAGVGTFSKRLAKLRQSLSSWPVTQDEGVSTDRIVLGRSLLDDDPFPRIVGFDDDANMFTVGSIGSGKSTTVIYPNLSTYKGSAIVIDPKGEHAAMTLRRRSSAGFLVQNNIGGKTRKHFSNAEAFMLDPFAVNKHLGLPTRCYNPLTEINLSDPNCRQIISAIADGCISPESDKNKYFEDMARSFFQGLIAYVLDKHPPHKQNLPFVVDLMYGINEDGFADSEVFKELLLDMLTSSAAGGLPQQAASEIGKMGEKERGAVLSTVARNLKWIGDPAMRRQLTRSDFQFSDFGIKTVMGRDGRERTIIQTLYLVLPDTRMSEQMRWIRTMTAVGLSIMQNRVQKPTLPILFILDEFPKLGGQIKAISDGFGTLRGYKIKLWCFIQNLGQLKHDYPKRWSSMLGNSNIQVFGAGMGDPDTAKWVSETLGKNASNGRPKELLTSSEVATKLGQKANMQVVFPAMGLPLRLERLSFKPLKLDGKRFRGIGLDGLRGHFEDW